MFTGYVLFFSKYSDTKVVRRRLVWIVYITQDLNTVGGSHPAPCMWLGLGNKSSLVRIREKLGFKCHYS